MTSTEALARVRTLLDEASTGFWTNTEVYSALTDGQKEVANIVLSIYRVRREANPLEKMPTILINLLTNVTGTNKSSSVEKPNDFWQLSSAKFARITGETEKTCIVKIYDDEYLRSVDNLYSKPSKGFPHVYDFGTTIEFNPSSSSGDYTIYYFKKTTDIDENTEPILPEETHNAIVQYAYEEVIVKDIENGIPDHRQSQKMIEAIYQ